MTPVNPDVLQALSFGIQAEVAAYIFYLEAAKKSEAAQFKDVLEKLAYEEKNHFHILERQHHSLIKSEHWVSTADVMKMEGLPEPEEDMSSRHKELIQQVRAADSVRKILDIAYRLEEDAHSLYIREMQRQDSPEGKKVFEDMARFEKGHMAVINDMIKKYA